MSDDNDKATITLAVGQPIMLSTGEQAFVSSFRFGWVGLIDASGKSLPIRPLKSVVRELMSPDSPPSDTSMIPGLLERLSPKARKRLAEHDAIARLVETGLGVHQGDHETPPDALNPELVPDETKRISNLAARMAPTWGVEYKSARTRIQRILKRRAQGLAGQVDSRYVRPRTDHQEPLMALWVQDFLIARQFDAVLSTSTLYLTFSVWLRANQPQAEVPPERTFSRLAGRVYDKFPHLRSKAKTKESIARGPKQSDAPRIPERPGELWLIDTTTSNIEVRDPSSRTGRSRKYRCDVTKIMDAHTRYIVGRSFAETTTGYGAVLALADAFASMVDERDTVTVNGRQYPLPYVGLPRALARYPIAPRRMLMDNGKPFLGHEFIWQLERLHIEAEPARVRDPRAKAPLERHFGAYKTEFEELQPGYIAGSLNERGEEVPGRYLPTWQDIFERDIAWTDAYNFSEHRGLEALTGRRISPYQRWAEGVSLVGSMEIPRWNNERLRFLPSFEPKFTKYGVTRKGQVFNAPILEILLLTPKVAIDRRYRFHYDPADLRQIYCFDPDGLAYEIPWVMRTEDTPQFGDFTRGQMDQSFDGLTADRKTYQQWMVAYLMRWMEEDARSSADSPLLSRNEIMHAAAMDRLKGIDSGRIERQAGVTPFPPDAWAETPDDDIDDDDFFGDEDPFEAFG